MVVDLYLDVSMSLSSHECEISELKGRCVLVYTSVFFIAVFIDIIRFDLV